MDNGKFTVLDELGKEVVCDALFTFDSEETKKSYVVYTDGKKDAAGVTQVYASIYDPTSESTKLEPITSEKEWKVVETILKTLEDEVKNKKAESNEGNNEQ